MGDNRFTGDIHYTGHGNPMDDSGHGTYEGDVHYHNPKDNSGGDLHISGDGNPMTGGTTHYEGDIHNQKGDQHVSGDWQNPGFNDMQNYWNQNGNQQAGQPAVVGEMASAGYA